MKKQPEIFQEHIRLGLDLDGVIYDFFSEFRELIAAERNVSIDQLPETTNWHFYEDWGMSFEEYSEKVSRFASEGKIFASGNMYDGAIEATRRLKEMGYHIVIITARDVDEDVNTLRTVISNTRAWLDANDITYDELIVNNDKTIHDLSILIDDSIANIEKFIESGSGVTYIFDRPWNQGNNFYSRLSGWEEVCTEMQSIQDQYNQAFEQFLAVQS